MSVSTTSRVEALRRKLEITQRDMARLLGITERTLIDLEQGRPLSTSISRRVTEIERLTRELAKVVRQQRIGSWLSEPNDAFDENAPTDLIASGKSDLLWQMIFELRSGAGA